MTEIIFASSWVGPDGIQPDATKLTAVINWCQPLDLLNLSCFLGLTGYFQDLVKGYAKITRLLTDLVHSVSIPKMAGKAVYQDALSKVKLTNIWNSSCKSMFLKLKEVLTSEPVLKVPHFDGTLFIVTSDGCQEDFGAMLTQCFTGTQPSGKIIRKLHPIAYASKCTSKSESHYKLFLLELTALKFVLDKFNSIVWSFPVKIETDCQALQDVL